MKSKYYWHIHHGILFEELTEPIKNRIAYIKSDKPECEVALRLRLLKPVKDQKRLIAILTAYRKALAPALEAYEKAKATALEAKRDEAINALHAKECPDCPWDGMTIFPKRSD